MPSPDPAHGRNVVLIHGAWQGGWVWDGTVSELEAAGFRAHPLDLPGNGYHPVPFEQATFKDCIDHAVGTVDRCEGEVSLIAHSGGGMVAGKVAEARPDRLDRIIYVAGMMLPSGLSFTDLIGEVLSKEPSVLGIWPHLEPTADGKGTRVPPAAAREIFYHDCAPEAAAAAAAKLEAQPDATRAVTTGTLTSRRFGKVARAYVECLRDRSILLSMQRRMQTLMPGALRFSLDTGHAPMLARPQAFIELILEILTLPLSRFHSKGM